MTNTSAVALAAICSTLLTFSWHGGLAPAAAAAQAPAVAQYHCPMHPSYLQDHKGDCPVCGMKLVPVKSAAQPSAPAEAASVAVQVPERAAAPTMAIGADKQQVLGIAVTQVQRSAGARTLRVLGRVAVDEARLYKLNAGMGGSVRDVSPVATGSRVRKGQVLGSFYAPDALSMMQLFIVNTQGYDRPKMGRQDGAPAGEGHGEDNVPGTRRGSSLSQANVQQRVMQLENLGVPELQRDEMARTGKIPEDVKIVSPTDGVVLARGVFPGLKFDRGFEFYRIADLRKIWVLADVFMQDARHVRAGMRAEVSAPEQMGTLPAVVTEILPQFDAATRTLKVKLALDNPGFALRPDMFVDVALKIDLPAGVVVPSDAIVDSGLVKRVFVQTAEGVFQPRAVETGWRSGDQVEVVKGLRPGELVVTSGTFFLDSETRMRPPASGAAAANGTMPAPSGHRPPGGAGDSPGGAGDSPGGAGGSKDARVSAAREEVTRGHAGDGR